MSTHVVGVILIFTGVMGGCLWWFLRNDMRIAPRPLLGLFAFVVYLAIVFGAILGSLVLPIGRDTIQRWWGHGLFLVMLGLGAVFLVLFTRYVGWWRPVMREEPRTAPRWTMAVTALYLVAGLAVAARPGVPTLGALQTFWLGFYSVLFGFSFVILYQGLLLVAFRASMPEVGVWFLTSLMFAFLGMIFAFILGGQTFLGYAETIGVWFLLGTSLYVVRMAQGSLVPAMLVCVLWDFALRTGSVVATDRVIRRPDWSVDGLSPVEGLTFWLMLIVTVVAAWRIILAKNAATAAKPLPLQRTSKK